ncbi:hypothetical protein GGQ54_001581 [Naumannella cuiyingiana]|uniref:Uncharacterized protein n=1 Tax=Naumannella cuiyingiana TaxID=1347891 RepID=A0A7Z0D8P6_9ACTN|nr:hypothetical protein [Naumannella cuiyingiana]
MARPQLPPARDLPDPVAMLARILRAGVPPPAPPAA